MSSSEEPSTNKPRSSIFNGMKRRASSAYESAGKAMEKIRRSSSSAEKNTGSSSEPSSNKPKSGFFNGMKKRASNAYESASATAGKAMEKLRRSSSSAEKNTGSSEEASSNKPKSSFSMNGMRKRLGLSSSSAENIQNATLQKITDPKELKIKLKKNLSDRYKKLEKLKEQNKNKAEIKSKSAKVNFTDMTQKMTNMERKYISFALSVLKKQNNLDTPEKLSVKNQEEFHKKIFEDIFYNNLKNNYTQIINFYLPKCNQEKNNKSNTVQNSETSNKKVCKKNSSEHVIVFINKNLSELFIKDKKLYSKIIGKLPPYSEKQFLIGLERDESITFEKGLLILKAGSTVFLDVAFTASVAAIHGIGYAVTGATFAAAAASPIGALAMGGIASMFATHFILDGYRRHQRLNNPRLSFNTKYMPNQGFRAFESEILAKYHKLFYYDEYNFESNNPEEETINENIKKTNILTKKINKYIKFIIGSDVVNYEKNFIDKANNLVCALTAYKTELEDKYKVYNKKSIDKFNETFKNDNELTELYRLAGLEDNSSFQTEYTNYKKQKYSSNGKLKGKPKSNKVNAKNPESTSSPSTTNNNPNQNGSIPENSNSKLQSGSGKFNIKKMVDAENKRLDEYHQIQLNREAENIKNYLIAINKTNNLQEGGNKYIRLNDNTSEINLTDRKEPVYISIPVSENNAEFNNTAEFSPSKIAQYGYLHKMHFRLNHKFNHDNKEYLLTSGNINYIKLFEELGDIIYSESSLGDAGFMKVATFSVRFFANDTLYSDLISIYYSMRAFFTKSILGKRSEMKYKETFILGRFLMTKFLKDYLVSFLAIYLTARFNINYLIRLQFYDNLIANESHKLLPFNNLYEQSYNLTVMHEKITNKFARYSTAAAQKLSKFAATFLTSKKTGKEISNKVNENRRVQKVKKDRNDKIQPIRDKIIYYSLLMKYSYVAMEHLMKKFKILIIDFDKKIYNKYNSVEEEINTFLDNLDHGKLPKNKKIPDYISEKIKNKNINTTENKNENKNENENKNKNK